MVDAGGEAAMPERPLRSVDATTTAILGQQRAAIDATVDGLVGGRPVALLGFPNHGNPGDEAIWLGAEAVLRRVRAHIGYRASPVGFDADAMAAAIGRDGVVVLNGGGNFGDLYAGQQDLREHVLERCRSNPVVQLPQSIHFAKAANLARMQRLVAGHGAVTILCREQASSTLAAAAFDATVAACPDMSLGLTALPAAARTTPPLADEAPTVVWITRHDAETMWQPPHRRGIVVVDWAQPVADSGGWPTGRRRSWLAIGSATRAMGRHPRLARVAWRPVTAGFCGLATAWVAQAAGVLASAPVVVTERLHGHLLGLLAGVPHVVLDGGYGKIGAVLDGPTGASPLVHRATSVDDAVDQALAIAAAAVPSTP